MTIVSKEATLGKSWNEENKETIEKAREYIETLPRTILQLYAEAYIDYIAGKRPEPEKPYGVGKHLTSAIKASLDKTFLREKSQNGGSGK